MAGSKKATSKKVKSSARAQAKQDAAARPDAAAAAPAGPDEQTGSAGKVRAFYVVGIGASAGGLDALREFFGAMPEKSGAAYIVISHLAPDHKSILGQLLQKHTKLPIVEAEDQMQVRPDHVYLIPPAKEMSILRGRLQLMDPARNNEVRYPIDAFFRSLAQDQGEHAIGVILSGTGTDGTRSIKDIKNEGGLVIVQDSQDALYTGMPLSAAETGLADYVLAVKKMPKTIADYVRHALNLQLQKISRGDMERTDQLNKVFVLIRNEVGLDFSLYKRDHLIRGIQKQMSMHRIEAMDEYVRFLRVNPEEVGRLARALLIKVTRFFRDDFAFEVLKRKALPLITKGKDKKTPLRIWVPGCATGEEAYSIAMVMREYMEETQNRFALQIFATDVDSHLVELGRTGLYSAGITEDVSPERLERFFDQVGPEYKIRDDLRSTVIFATQDLVKGPTFTRLDLISCRNVLIYMGAQLQKRLIPLFHYCLNPGGVLFLGTSETIGSFTDVFSAVDNKARIFQAKRVKSPPLPKSMRMVQIPEMPQSSAGDGGGEAESAGALLDRALLALAANPGGAAMADNIREVVSSGADQVKGTTTRGKETAGKSRPRAQQQQVRELRERLQTTVEELETSNEELRSANEELESVNEELLTLNAEFQNKIDELADAHANMDILLEGAQIATVFLGQDLRIRSFTPSITGIVNLVPSDVGRSLRDFSSHMDYPNMMGDLAQTVETGNPVERTVRHEDGMWYLARVLPYRRKGRIDGAAITFINVTGQREIQQRLQDALVYAEGIVETVREPLLILNADLRVLTGNHAFYRTFRVTKEDTEGRLVYDLGNRQWDIPDLRKLLEEILPQRSQFEDYVVAHVFQTIGRRTMRLNARQIVQAERGTAMILLAMEDITGAAGDAVEEKP